MRTTPTFMHVLALWLGMAAVCAAAAHAEVLAVVLTVGFMTAIILADSFGRF